ncbi:GntR family transcriptional regulator [Aquabacterium sp.]|jgi:DNA-binding GntR family transcriptional regulator|uniref:GntR family transcriptional regulator n=1 Tax=Aquabacterium sp. TaxID=1872578 RepID=UPI0025C34FA5|nr:GntR family transcriptional regulator [Aquabacterium sp.]
MPRTAGSLKIDRSQKTLRELTLEKMRDAIIGQYFQPGQRLVERTLCDELGVSRTVVREVLRHLETEGLVNSPPNQGPTVATIDADTTRQVYTVRALLEGHAAAACARLASEQDLTRLAAAIMLIEAAFAQGDHATVLAETTRFYEVMFNAGGEQVAWGIVQSLNARINRLRAITIASKQRGQQAPGEMRRLLEALRARDEAAASEAAQAHVHSAAQVALSALAAEPAGA